MGEPCELQPETDDLPRVVAQEPRFTVGALELLAYRLIEDHEEGPSEGLRDFIPLTLDGWRTLVELFALRHPAHFRGVVAKWEAMQRKEVRHG